MEQDRRQESRQTPAGREGVRGQKERRSKNHVSLRSESRARLHQRGASLKRKEERIHPLILPLKSSEHQQIRHLSRPTFTCAAVSSISMVIWGEGGGGIRPQPDSL